MLKRKFSNLGELGSMMVEAMAMLGLISMVTPIVYKKAAERNMEIQDVNAASQMRNLVKGIDEYILDNYGRIVDGDTVSNNCTGGENQNYNFSSSRDHIEVPIQHFCDYLPYGFIDTDSGTVSDNKVFDGDYRVVIKKMDSQQAQPDGNPITKSVLTGFIMATPKNVGDFPKIRSSRISSMVGGNGGYIESNQAFGVQGLWGINDVEEELGLDTAQNGALLISSASPISSGGTNDDAVLYRREQTRRHLNAMETTLWMGLTEGDAQDIQNINQAVIVGTTLDDASPDSDTSLNKALWIRHGGGAFIDGVLGVAANETDKPSFYVDLDGAVRAAGEGTGKSTIGTEDTDPVGKFEINKDGALRTSDGKFIVDKDGAITAALNGVATAPDGTTSSYANFTVDKDGNVTAKGKAEIEKDLRVKGRSVLGDKNYNINDSLSGMDFTSEDSYELVVNGHAFVKGLLKVFHFKAENIDAAVLRAGAENSSLNSHLDYTLYVDKDKLAIGPLDNTTQLQDAKFTVQKDTGNTSIKGGNLTVQASQLANSRKILDANVEEEYVYTSGLRVGDKDVGNYPLEVANDSQGNITMRLRDNTSSIVGYDAADEEIMDFNNDYSRIQKKSGESYGNVTFTDKSSIIKTQTTTADASTVEVHDKDVYMDVTPADTINNFELSRRGATNSADLALRKSSGVKVFGEDTAPVLYVDPEAENKDNMGDRTVAEDSRGGVYIRRGVVDLESNNQADYRDVSGRFTAKGKKDVGYIRADMVIGKGTGEALDRNKTLYANNDATSNSEQYDSFMVNPAYTSVMHDIKLTSRGGARLSDILPDFINKGIYLADNTYSEDTGNWANITYSNTGGQVTPSTAAKDCQSGGGKSIYECATSPWLGVVPTPQCPPGYQKVIQVFPYGFNIAQAGSVGGKNREDFYIIPSQSEQYYDPSKDSEQPMPLYFQKNTWLRTRAMQIGKDADFYGWYVLMGYVYPEADFKDVWPAGSYPFIQKDTNNYIWNLYPVYYRELEAYANVYCYFSRGNFDSEFVDKNYDQLKNFRMPIDKTNDAAIRRLDDPNMDYKNPW